MVIKAFLPFFSGQTLTLELYPSGSSAIANGAGDSLTETDGLFAATVTESLTGWHVAVIKSGSTVIYTESVKLGASTVVIDPTAQLSAEIAAIEGGGGSVTYVNPLSAGDVQRSEGTAITAYVDEVSPITISAVTDAAGVAVDLSALTIAVHIEDQYRQVVETIADADIDITGDDSNNATFTPDAATVLSDRDLMWSLRDTDTGYVLAHGDLFVRYAARGE